MLVANLQPAIVTLATSSTLLGLVRPGQTLQGAIEGQPGDLTLQAGGARVPLPDPGTLTPGQAVTVEVVETNQGLQLRITPQQQPGRAPVPNAPSALPALVARVLATLGNVQADDSAATLVPANLPHTAEAIRTLVSLFVNRGTSGDDLQQIAAVLTQAAADGAIPQDAAANITTLIANVLASDAAEFEQLLQQLAGSARKPIEARLAILISRAEQSGVTSALKNDLLAQVSRLRQEGALETHLRGTGQSRAFQNTVGRVAERLTGGQLQNLRGLEQSYVFLELPFQTGAPLRHGQVHLFSDGHGKRRNIDANNATVALDLSMTKLGDLWITLRVVNGQCACKFRATSQPVADAIEAASGDLVQALGAAGYPRAMVQVALWDGDRLKRVTLLMRRFSGLDVQA